MAQQPGYGDPAFRSPPPFEPGDDRFAGPPAIVAAREARFSQAGEQPVGIPLRPTYREPHPVRALSLLAGLSGAALWMSILPLLGTSLPGYVWWTLIAGGVAWLAAVVLSRAGDRGAAAGIAITVGVAWAIAAYAVAVRWAEAADWPLW